MSKVTDEVERIKIERACEQLVYTYARLLDLGDLSGAADLFAENGSMARPLTPNQVIQGREAIRAALLTRPKTLLTKHLSTNVMVQVESHEAATGISYLTMIATTPTAEAQPPFLSNGPIYFGEFKDRFVREHGVWKFRSRLGSIQMKFGGATSA
jgi:SnoaL-like domain